MNTLLLTSVLVMATGQTQESATKVQFVVPNSNGKTTLTFNVTGEVEAVWFKLHDNGPNRDGSIEMSIKTSTATYNPRFGGYLTTPIDWKQYFEVTFQYPKNQVLRKYTASAFRIKDRDGKVSAHIGCPPVVDGDVAKIQAKCELGGKYVHGEVANSPRFNGEFVDFNFKIERVTGLYHSGSAGGVGRLVEVLVSSKKIPMR